jgi:hypothetical protein
MVNNGEINGLLAQDLIHIAIHPSRKFYNFVQVANIGLTTRSRNLVVKTFLDTTDAEWLLILDSDERLSVDTWLKLIEAADEKTRPIVSGLVFAAFTKTGMFFALFPPFIAWIWKQGFSRLMIMKKMQSLKLMQRELAVF